MPCLLEYAQNRLIKGLEEGKGLCRVKDILVLDMGVSCFRTASVVTWAPMLLLAWLNVKVLRFFSPLLEIHNFERTQTECFFLTLRICSA